MSCIVKEKRKGTSTVYAYESTSYWVPGKGPRCKRKLIGKIDPITGEIVPTGKRGRPPKANKIAPSKGQPSTIEAPANAGNELDRSKQQLIDAIASKQLQEARIAELTSEVRTLRAENQKLQERMNRVVRYIRETRSIVLKSCDACLDAIQDDNGSPSG